VVVTAIVNRVQNPSFDADTLLIERYLAGDQSAFEALYRNYYDVVYSVAKGILGDSDEAADATQEVFRLVLRNLKRFDRRARFSTWLYRIAINRSIQQARLLARRPKAIPLDAAAAVSTDAGEIADPRIQQALQELSPSDRAILVLFYWQELSLAEIAAAMECSANACKTRLFRARERFREAFERAE
jgi:RNA polymerase sigma-70 factor (ECF subfamily)